MNVKQQGFSLLELLIVIAVIAILSSIALPYFGEQLAKGRRAEGKAALLRTALAQERHYTTYGSYATTLNTLIANDGLSEVDGSGNTESGYYVISFTAATGSQFTARAQTNGSQWDDSRFCYRFFVDNLGVKTAVDWAGNDTTDRCWKM